MCSHLLCLSAALLCYTGFHNYSLIRSTFCSCSTFCFGLGFQLQNLQDFIKKSRALIKDIFLEVFLVLRAGVVARATGVFFGDVDVLAGEPSGDPGDEW